MSQGQVSPVLRFIRRVRSAAPAGGDSDGQLLNRFVGAGEEAAFVTLVRRHGPMVHSVCRRVLQNLHDAEDAFQADGSVRFVRRGFNERVFRDILTRNGGEMANAADLNK